MPEAGGLPEGGGGQARSVPQAEAQLTRAEVDLRQAKRELDGTKITAPVSGTVLTVDGTVGTQVDGPGTSGFVVLGDLNELQVRAEFSEADVVRLRLGQRATITFAAWPGEEYTGSVTRIDPAATVDGDLVRYGVMIALDERPDGLRLGQTASVRVVTHDAENVLRVPSAAVKEQRDGTYAVLVRRGDEASQRTVQVGVRGDRYVEITSGLSAGDRVVVHS